MGPRVLSQHYPQLAITALSKSPEALQFSATKAISPEYIHIKVVNVFGGLDVI